VKVGSKGQPGHAARAGASFSGLQGKALLGAVFFSASRVRPGEFLDHLSARHLAAGWVSFFFLSGGEIEEQAVRPQAWHSHVNLSAAGMARSAQHFPSGIRGPVAADDFYSPGALRRFRRRS